MKNSNPYIKNLTDRLIREAREKKIRVKIRLAALGNTRGIYPLSRGPIQSNGMNCIRWHFYERAVRNHQVAAAEIKERLKQSAKPDRTHKTMENKPKAPEGPNNIQGSLGDSSPMYEVYIAYPSQYYGQPDDQLRKLGEQHSAKFGGSGCMIGGGERDLQFIFETKETAKTFVKEAKKLKFEFKVRFIVSKLEDFEDDEDEE